MAKIWAFPAAAVPLPEGFSPYDQRTFDALLAQARFLERDAIERDPTYKQIIPYVIVRDAASGAVLVYQRSRRSGEARLFHKYSFGVGGHIEERDGLDRADHAAIFQQGMRREVTEEIGELGAFDQQMIGFLNDNSDPVGQVHCGVVVGVRVTGIAQYLARGEHDMLKLRQSLAWPEIRTIFDALENWSKILYQALTGS